MAGELGYGACHLHSFLIPPQVLRLVRVTRILRVFKLVRHFAGLQSLFCTLRQASKELGLLIMLVAVSVLTFSSLVYFSEKDEQNWSFVEAFWWGLLTITTVGYGKSHILSFSEDKPVSSMNWEYHVVILLLQTFCK